ncbi:MAG: exonuclease SbcCD subunit D [Candidatus Bathyarchaeota archaeon]|nr:exonuclease SbcCD subunit D [Candidatus Termiticorpusculum sp.]
MRLLHLSDLHVGKCVNGFSMLAEQRHVFEQIVGYVRSEAVDVVVVAGDVFDRSVPGVDAVCVFDDFLTALACEGVAVLLVAGNHDSPERLSYASRLLVDKGLFLCGLFDGSLRKVSFSDEFGVVNFWLLPFIKPLLVQGFFGDCRVENCNDAFVAVIKNAVVDFSVRNVLVAHQFFTKVGVDCVRSDSELCSVGGLDAVDVGIIEGFDYVALGHLHQAQNVGVDHVRYVGSPLKYSFSEVLHEKSVLLVEINEKNSGVNIRVLPLVPLHDMREIKGKIADLMSCDVVSLANREDYLRVILTDEDEIVSPMEKLRSVYPNIMSLSFENSRTKNDFSDVCYSSEFSGQLSLYELFSEFFLKMCGSTMNLEQMRVVKKLFEGEDVL